MNMKMLYYVVKSENVKYPVMAETQAVQKSCLLDEYGEVE